MNGNIYMKIDKNSSYALIKYPASARHLTLIVEGSRDRNRSQFNMAVNPPAEHPANIACTVILHL